MSTPISKPAQVPLAERIRREKQYRVRPLEIPRGPVTMQVERAGFEPGNTALRLVFAVSCPFRFSAQVDLSQDDAKSLIEQMQAWLEEPNQ